MKRFFSLFFIIFILTFTISCKEEHTHSYIDTVVNPTCINKGYTKHTCECGEYYVDTYKNATGHTYDEWVITLEPTDETNGIKERVCIDCGHKELGTINKLSHEHCYVAEYYYPTCTEDGYIQMVCACGDNYQGDILESEGHKFGKWTIVKEATEVEDGLKIRTCENCDETEEEIIIALNHVHSYSTEVIPPTCTEGGYTIYTCTCKHTYNDDFTGPNDHDFEDWIILSYPINELPGIKRKDCKNCEYFEEEEFILTMPTYTVPTDLTGTYGDILANIALPEGFVFEEDLDTKLSEIGMNVFHVTYTDLSETGHWHHPVTGIEVYINVLPKEITIDIDLTYLDNLIYNGNPINKPVIPQELIDIIDIKFKKDNQFIDYFPVNAGNYEIIISPKNNSYHFEMISKEFTILKNNSFLDSIELETKYYTGEPVEFSKEFGANVLLTFKKNGLEISGAPIEIGKYSVIVELLDSENYGAQVKEFEFSILKDEEAPTWNENSLITSDVNVKIEAYDNARVAYYIIGVYSNAIENTNYFKSIDGTFIGEMGYDYYVDAVDASGNVSSTFTVMIRDSYSTFTPENVYPNNTIINKSYVELNADGATNFMIGTSIDEMQFVSNAYSYIYYLENNTTYYWLAIKGDNQSEVYSFDVKYEEVGQIKNIYPENGSIVTEEFPKLVVESDYYYKVYYSYTENAYNEYYSDSQTYRIKLLNNRIVYWYAEDINGNKTDVWSFVYQYDISDYPSGLYILESDVISYVNKEYITYYGYAELGIHSFEAFVVEIDGTYESIKQSDYTTNYIGIENATFSIGKTNKLTNGQTVFICVVDTKMQRSEYKKFIIDLENPICGSATAEFNEKWNINITVGTDNIGASYFYRINNGEWISYNSNVTLQFEDQLCFVDLKAVDFAGNISYSSFKFSDDVTLPMVNVTLGELNKYVNTDIELTVTPVDGYESYYFINGAQYLLSEEVRLSFTEEGVNSFYVATVIDETIYISEEYKLMIDKTAPEFGEIYYLDERFNINGTYTYAFIDYDKINDMSNTEVYYKLDLVDDNWIKIDEYGHAKLGGYYFTESGYFDLYFKVVDEAGNETIKSATLFIDTVGPSLDNIKFDYYYDDKTQETKCILTVSDIIDDYGYYYHMHFQIWNQNGYDNGLPAIVEESFYVEEGTTEFSYDMSYLPNGTTYYFLIYVVDDLINETYSNLYYFYKYDLGTAVEIDGYHFELTDGKYNLFKYTGEEEYLVLPESVNGESYSIGERTFSGNDKIKSVQISNGVTSIGTEAFSNCSNLETIIMSNSIEKIGSSVFSDCSKLKEVTLSNNLKSIGDFCFYNCTSLIYNEYENGYYLGSADNKYLLFIKASTKVSNFKIHNDTIKIEAGAFWNDSILETIDLPAGLLDIGVEAFGLCINLKEILLPSYITEIKDSTFIGCTNLEIVDLNNVQKIDRYAFSECNSLTEINIPDSVEIISNHAFSFCIGLEVITLGTGLKTLEPNAFYCCSNIKIINYNAILMDDLTTTSYIFYTYEYADYGITLNIGNNVERVPACLLYGRKNIEKIIFEDGSICKSIGEFAFRDCELLQEIIIPEGVISIENNAFIECDNLKYVSIPNTLEIIGGTGLNQCEYLVYNEYNNGLYLGNETNPYLLLVKVKLTSDTELIIHEDCKLIHTFFIWDSMSITDVYIPKNVRFIAINAIFSNLIENIVLEDPNNWYINEELIDYNELTDPFLAMIYLRNNNYDNYIYKK